MFVKDFDSKNDIVDCLNSRITDPAPKLPIHTILNFFRATCTATIEQSGQPSISIKPPTKTVQAKKIVSLKSKKTSKECVTEVEANTLELRGEESPES